MRLGLWQMEDTVGDLLCARPDLKRYEEFVQSHFRSETRRMEYLCVRALLHEMLTSAGVRPDKIGEITHNEAGKPLLKGYRISISHTQGYVALMLSRKQEVAVDIEYVSDRVERVRSKFMRKDEQATDLSDLLVHWCAKETVYKLFSADNLQYSEMRVKPFDSMAEWACEVENLRSGQTVRVEFELTMEFVLTYGWL